MTECSNLSSSCALTFRQIAVAATCTYLGGLALFLALFHGRLIHLYRYNHQNNNNNNTITTSSRGNNSSRHPRRRSSSSSADRARYLLDHAFYGKLWTSLTLTFVLAVALHLLVCRVLNQTTCTWNPRFLLIYYESCVLAFFTILLATGLYLWRGPPPPPPAPGRRRRRRRRRRIPDCEETVNAEVDEPEEEEEEQEEEEKDDNNNHAVEEKIQDDELPSNEKENGRASQEA